MIWELSGCVVSAMSAHLVPDREEVSVKTEAVAQRAQVELEVACQVVDNPTDPAARVMFHVVLEVLCAFARWWQISGRQYLVRCPDVIRHDILEQQVYTACCGYG